MMRDRITPALRGMGFRGSMRMLRYTRGGRSGALRLQKSRYSSRRRVDFTFHVYAPCMGEDVIVYLIPERDRPVSYWWELPAGGSADGVAESVLGAVRDYALPAILAGLDAVGSGEDRPAEPDSEGPVHRGRPGPECDGAGADPGSWFVQPGGGQLDFAFADLVSPERQTRLSAVETIGQRGLGDRRAIPALLDRLHSDTSPYVRRVVAAHVLAAVPAEDRIRAALEVALADSDCGVRWAAGYALRLSRRASVPSE